MIFGYAWVNTKQADFPAVEFTVDGESASIAWAISQPEATTCMPFSVAVNFLPLRDHQLSINWDWRVPDLPPQEAILTHVLVSNFTAPSVPASPQSPQGCMFVSFLDLLDRIVITDTEPGINSVRTSPRKWSTSL